VIRYRRCRARRGRFRPSLGVVLSAAFLPAILAAPANAQEELTLAELELAYRSSLDEYRAAFQALEVLESRFNRASQAFDSARAAGDKGRQEQALAITYQLGPERRLQALRVEEKARDLRVARDRLLDARAAHLEELLRQAEQARNADERQELAILVRDMRNQIAELRALEDPEVVLEPEPNIFIEPRDGYEEIRIKADMLDGRGVQYEELLAEIDRQLEGLRRDLRLMRQSDDFVAGVERFGDLRLPVGPPGARSDRDPALTQPSPGGDSPGAEERPLTLEERIQALVVTREEVAERIERIRVKAESFRRQIRLDMAGLRSLYAGETA
jgi:hypothetical protein